MKVTGLKRRVALLLIAALFSGVLPMKEGVGSRAAERPVLRNPRILKGTQEVAPGSGGQRELKNPTTENGISTWDSIWFGNYWQEDTNGDGKADKNDEKQPIKWRVLSVDGDDVFLLADKNLDVQRYNDTDTDVTWETCTMRSWLNGYGAEANSSGKDYGDNNFLNNAFTEEEQSAIKTTKVINNDNSEYGTEGGSDTLDKVYLLSMDEVMNPAYGFTSDIDVTATRNAVNTAYVAEGGEIDSSDRDSAGSSDDWWLRSPGDGRSNAAYVLISGYVYRSGNYVYTDNVGVRPALHLNLKASSDAISTSSWSYAGIATSDDKVEWDCVWFGNYWQEDTNGDGKADKNDTKQPIKWRVLSVDGEDAFLIADKNLDCQEYNDTDIYNDTGISVTWETCTIRSWLNGYGTGANKEGKDYSSNNFLINAFAAGERSAIRTTNVANKNNPKYNTEGGNDTSDKVYLLSLDEVKNPGYGLSSDYNKYNENRRAKNTGYAEGQGAYTSTSTVYAGNGEWWLRSLGHYSDDATLVDSSGHVHRYGISVSDDSVGVRPALHLNLKSSLDAISTSSWLYAGTVISGGGEKEEASPQPTEPGSTQKSETSAVPQTTANPVQTGELTAKPSEKPDIDPTTEPSSKPEVKPDGETTAKPSEKPDINPTTEPSSKPDVKPDEGSTAKPEEPEEPTEKPHCRMGIKVDRYRYKTSSSVNGAALPVTKGRSEEVTLLGYNLKREKNPVNWAIGNTNIAEITTIKTNKKGKSSIAVIKGKKYGKTTLTAEYGGQKTTITIKIVKNEYSAKPRKSGILSPTGKGYSTIGKCGMISMYFDKKGNIIYKYYQKYRRTKKGRNHIKSNEQYYFHCKADKTHREKGCLMTLKTKKGEVAAEVRQKILCRADTKNKVYVDQYKIKKSKIKMKREDIDLRTCKLLMDLIEEL